MLVIRSLRRPFTSVLVNPEVGVIAELWFALVSFGVPAGDIAKLIEYPIGRMAGL
ncbi:MAG: hypothetical protein ACJ72Z_08745 [Pyrinomonadaceae bacterium]